MQSIAVVDYKSGNLLSIKRAVEKFNTKVKITSDYDEILSSDKIILPGVGAFGNAINKLKSIRFTELIQEPKFKKIPLLGICLGMQLLFDNSFELGSHKGLGLMKGDVKLLPKYNKNFFKIPNIGWHKLHLSPNKADLFNFLKYINPKDRFYFVHSYCVYPKELTNIKANYFFDKNAIPAIVSSNNIIGFQFHPEKSGDSGLKLIQSFLNL